MTGDAAVLGIVGFGVLVWETLRQVRIAKLRRMAEYERAREEAALAFDNRLIAVLQGDQKEGCRFCAMEEAPPAPPEWRDPGKAMK